MSERRALRARSQQGETLLESLLSIVILSMVALAAYSGLTVAIIATNNHRESGVSETVLRSTAERLVSPDEPYVARAGCGAVGYPLDAAPSGYAVTISAVEFWNPGPSSPVTDLQTDLSATCPASDAADAGLQRIELTVTTPTGRVERLAVVKRRT